MPQVCSGVIAATFSLHCFACLPGACLPACLLACWLAGWLAFNLPSRTRKHLDQRHQIPLTRSNSACLCLCRQHGRHSLTMQLQQRHSAKAFANWYAVCLQCSSENECLHHAEQPCIFPAVTYTVDIISCPAIFVHLTATFSSCEGNGSDVQGNSAHCSSNHAG